MLKKKLKVAAIGAALAIVFTTFCPFSAVNAKAKVNVTAKPKNTAQQSISLQDVYSKKSVNEKKALTTFMNNFAPENMWNFDDFDVKSFKNKEDDIAIFLYYYGLNANDFKKCKIEKNPDYSDECWLLPINKLNMYCYNLFGTKIDSKNNNISNGYYYLPVGNAGDAPVFKYQILKMYSIANSNYYLEFKVPYFDEDGKAYNKTGYAIIKEIINKGTKTYRLLKYNSMGKMLTQNQIKSYK